MQVVEGELVSSLTFEAGRDIRWESGHDRRVVPMPGSHLFGCSVGLSRRLLYEVNGYDELCDGMGGEDYQLGVRLELAGVPMFFSRRMLTVESDEHHLGEGQRLERRDYELSRVRLLGPTGRMGGDGSLNRRKVRRLAHGAGSGLTGSGPRPAWATTISWATLGPADLEGTASTLPTTYWFRRPGLRGTVTGWDHGLGKVARPWAATD